LPPGDKVAAGIERDLREIDMTGDLTEPQPWMSGTRRRWPSVTVSCFGRCDVGGSMLGVQLAKQPRPGELPFALIVWGDRPSTWAVSSTVRPGESIVDEDAAHEPRGDAIELDAILPRGAPLIHQANIQIVDHRRRAERVIAALELELALGDPAAGAVQDEPVPSADRR
jgi:hypothetical protein